jgi:hypothetical protein
VHRYVLAGANGSHRVCILAIVWTIHKLMGWWKLYQGEHRDTRLRHSLLNWVGSVGLVTAGPRSQHAWVRDAARGWCLAICGLEGGCDRARGVEVRLRRMGAVRQAHGGRKGKGAAILLACTSDNVTWAWSRGRRNLARREGSL